MCIWVENCNKIVYKLNRFPHMVLKEKTLEVSHFHAFGCPNYIFVPKEKRAKLEP
jgi:hypothetical protein